MYKRQYQDSQNFDAKEFKKDWEIVLDVYPEIEQMRLELTKYSIQLSFLFQAILISNQTYKKAEKLKDILLDNFLTKHFGNDITLRDFATSLFMSNKNNLALELSRYISVLGNDDSQKLMNAFFKKFPEAKKLYENEDNDTHDGRGKAINFSSIDNYLSNKE